MHGHACITKNAAQRIGDNFNVQVFSLKNRANEQHTRNTMNVRDAVHQTSRGLLAPSDTPQLQDPLHPARQCCRTEPYDSAAPAEQ